jgi:hypothetical protein
MFITGVSFCSYLKYASNRPAVIPICDKDPFLTLLCIGVLTAENELLLQLTLVPPTISLLHTSIKPNKHDEISQTGLLQFSPFFHLQSRRFLIQDYCRSKHMSHLQYCPRETAPYGAIIIQSDSELLSGFPFIGHGNPDNTLESFCIFHSFICTECCASGTSVYLTKDHSNNNNNNNNNTINFGIVIMRENPYCTKQREND